MVSGTTSRLLRMLIPFAVSEMMIFLTASLLLEEDLEKMEYSLRIEYEKVVLLFIPINCQKQELIRFVFTGSL